MTRLFQEHPRVLIVVEFTPLAVAGLLLGKLLGSRCLLLIENDPAFRGSPGGTLKLFVKSKLASLADLILTNNQHGHAFITQRLRFDPSRVRVAPYLTSCPEAVGCQESPSPPLLKRNEHRVNILYLNSITERKGLHILIHAVEHLSPTDRAQLLFHIVGGGERLNELRDLVRSTGLSSEFIFYGPVEYRKIGDFYSNADLYISPTLQDYRSLGGFEALSYGLPLLISQRDGACDEIVTEGSNGWTFDPLNQGQLCYLLEKIARNPCMLTNFRLESLQMRNAFSVLSASSNLAAAISELLAHQIID